MSTPLIGGDEWLLAWSPNSQAQRARVSGGYGSGSVADDEAWKEWVRSATDNWRFGQEDGSSSFVRSILGESPASLYAVDAQQPQSPVKVASRPPAASQLPSLIQSGSEDAADSEWASDYLGRISDWRSDGSLKPRDEQRSAAYKAQLRGPRSAHAWNDGRLP